MLSSKQGDMIIERLDRCSIRVIRQAKACEHILNISVDTSLPCIELEDGYLQPEFDKSTQPDVITEMFRSRYRGYYARLTQFT